jgi:glycosyltransferase involved in cell wall biosynthesis
MEVINVCSSGHLDPYDSYGLTACQLARHLTALGAYVNLMPLGNRLTPGLPPDVAAIAQQPIKAAWGGILLGYPTGFHHYGALCNSRRRVAVSMFESSKIPTGWAEQLNQCAAVVTPSRFCRDVFLDCGVKAPIHVAPLGVGEAYKPAERSTGRPFTFLAFLDRGLRKGGIAALQAFLQAFGDDPAYRLILKQREVVIKAEILNPNVTAISQDMTEQELYNLYLQSDVLVNPNRGEGFGLIPREFSSTGGISLATDWGGTADHLGFWGVRLPYSLVPADWSSNKRLAGQDLGFWAEPDVPGVAAVMREIADNREAYRQRAMQRAGLVRSIYSWRCFAEKVLEIWRGD